MDTPYTVKGPMNRPKGMYVVDFPVGDGYKDRAQRLIGDGLNCRWSRQAGGYTASPSKLKKFEKMYAEGWDACAVTGKLYPPEPIETREETPMDTPKGRGFGNYIKGERITDIATIHTGDLLLVHSTQFDADNTVIVCKDEFPEAPNSRVWVHFVNPDDWTERGGEDFCIWGRDLSTDELYRAMPGSAEVPRGTIEDAQPFSNPFVQREWEQQQKSQDDTPVPPFSEDDLDPGELEPGELDKFAPQAQTDEDEDEDSDEADTTPKPEPVTTSHAIVVDVSEFRAALELAVSDRKTTIPVLAEVCLEPHGSSLHVLSTDLDKWTVTEVPAMIDDGTGMILLPHRKTLELLKGETGILRITAKVTTLSDKFSHCWVKLEVGGCEYDIPSMNPMNFPVCPEIPTSAFTVPGADLKAVIGRIIQCISNESSRYTLNGAQFESGNGKLLIVATDGHRLALDSIPVPHIPTGKALIYRDALAWLYKQGKGDVDVTLGKEYSCFRVVDAHTAFITRNIKGSFPDYKAVTPRQDAMTMTATFPSGDELAKMLAKVARMADERSGTVKFALNGKCVLSASSTDTGSASATVKAVITHSDETPEIVTGFNSAYVLDALKVAGKSPVVLSLKDAQSAGVFTVPSLPEYSYVIMPMRM